MLHDFTLGTWNSFDKIKLDLYDFDKADFDTEKYINTSKNKQAPEPTEPRKNIMYLDAMVNEGGGINYERNILNELLFANSFLNFRVGFQYFLEPFIISGFPVQLNYIVGKTHCMELGIGALFDYHPPNKNSNLSPKSIKGLFTIGYRYHEWDGGNVIRVGYAPFLTSSEGKDYILYISYGFSW